MTKGKTDLDIILPYESLETTDIRINEFFDVRNLAEEGSSGFGGSFPSVGSGFLRKFGNFLLLLRHELLDLVIGLSVDSSAEE